MDCESVKKIIDEYYNAKLTKQDMAQVAKHLQGCIECKKYFISMACQKDRYSLGKRTLSRLTNDFIELNLNWDI